MENGERVYNERENNGKTNKRVMENGERIYNKRGHV